MKHCCWIFIFHFPFIYALITPTGPRLWDNVALFETLAETIESQVDLLNSSSKNVDIAGTFTVIDALIDKSIVMQSDVDILYQSYIDVQSITQVSESKSCVIASITDVIKNQIDTSAGDINGTFTLIDGIEQNLLAKYAQAQLELEGIEVSLDVLTGQVLAHFVATFTTIAELSEELGSTVTSLQALSQLSESQTDALISLLDEIKLEARTIDSKVDVLQLEVESDFDGTFTVLDAVEAKLCDSLSSLEGITLSVTVDLNGTFTAIAAIEQKVCMIESVVEAIDQTLGQQMQEVITLDSKVDIMFAKSCAVESKSFVIEHEVTTIASLIDNIVIGDVTNKLNELEANTNIIESKACVLQTSVDDIALQNDRVDSFVDTFAVKVSNIDSSVDNIISFADNIIPTICTVASKVEAINSNIEFIDTSIASLIDNVVVQQDALQSVQENICQSVSKIDPINSNLDIANSKMTALINEIVTIESRTDIIEQTVETIQSRCDVIEAALINIESSVDITNSLIDETFDKACTVESKLSSLVSKVENLQFNSLCELLEDLQLDIRGTWTELDVINEKIASIDMQIDMFESRLALLLDFVDADFSGTYTALHALLQKECTIDSKIDVLNSLVYENDCGQEDLRGTFTILDEILHKLCIADLQIDTTLERIESIKNCLGTPIRQVDVGTTGFNILTEGEYYLAEDINFAPGATNLHAIGIGVNNVTLNLNGYTITQTNAIGTTFGIRIQPNFDNVEIRNGTIQNTTNAGILFDGTNVAIRLCNIQCANCGNNGVCLDPGCSDVTMEFVITINCLNHGIFIDDAGSDIRMVNCWTINGTAAGIRIDMADNLVMINCAVLNAQNNGINLTVPNGGTNYFLINCYSADCGSNGIHLRGPSNGVVKGCTSNNNFNDGIRVRDASNVEVINCSVQGNAQSGIYMFSSSQCFVHANRCINNGQASVTHANIRETGAGLTNSYLNNFALSTGTGPNYSIAGGTTGFSSVTLQEGTASTPSPFPQKWTNINMIP